MTDTVAEVAEPTDPTPPATGVTEPTPVQRILLALAAVAAVVPFFWAAVRDARNGFYPTMDVAATVTRARATFGPNPPLLGMWSSGSSWAGHEIHFPGPILLYLLAVPTHLFGNTWGPLVGMAVINSFFVLLVGWLILRHVGPGAALVGFALLNAFLWSLGSENLIDPRPMEMVTIPFLCFLLLVWLVASGRIEVLPWLAVVANYLFLNHLVMSLQIPVVGLCAVVGVVIWIRRVRAPDRPAGTADDEPGPLRRLRRPLVWTAIVTFVMWLPSLIQQVTHSPGNLRLLVEASAQHRNPVGSVTVGFTTTMRLIVEPTFWFRGRFTDPGFRSGLRDITAWDVIGTAILAGVLVWLVVTAWRRRDHLVLGAVGVSVVGIVVGIVTVTQAPGGWGFPLQYLRSLWGLAAFVWFTVLFGLWRGLAPRWRAGTATAAGVAAVLFGILGLSFANYGAATDMRRSVIAERFVDRLLPELEDRGPINLVSGANFEAQRFFSSAVLALDTAGIPYCVNHHASQQYGPEHDCLDDDNVTVMILAPDGTTRPDAELLAEVGILTPSEQEEFDTVRGTVEAWFASGPDLAITDDIMDQIEEHDPQLLRLTLDELESGRDDLDELTSSVPFLIMVGLETHNQVTPDDEIPLFVDRSMPFEAIARYAELNKRGFVRAYEITGDASGARSSGG